MKYADSVVDLIGGTPLVRLNRVTEGISATVLAKVEYLNPGGSAKDRIATRIIDAAEREGLLKPGGTIVEPTSGNTGVGLALVAQQRGYRCVFVLPDKVGEDKRNVLTAYGAEIVVTPTAVAPEDPESYYSVSDRLAREIPGAFKPNQYANPNGPRSHYETTGPEIWADTDGRVTHFVAGVGTGGTITGTGRYLREVSADRAGGRVQIVGVDPVGSVYSGGTGRPYLVEGVGEDFWPSAYDPAVVDRIVAVSDQQAFDLTLRLAREEGLLVGGSCGMAAQGALEVARELGPDDIVVVLLPDGGRGYLGKIFNDGWMRRHGFSHATGSPTVADLLGSPARPIAHLRREHTVADAVAALEAHGGALPVVAAEPPLVLGEVIGAVDARTLLRALATGAVTPADPITAAMGPGLPLVGAHESLEAAGERFGDRAAGGQHPETLLVLDGGNPIGLLHRTDLIAALAGGAA
ncbi:cystathionine beta-synthase [Microcella frigidaquae]|uniref:Cystathionine beta-synthase n=1 Tax=Microcella frigidaquae TaxID=424758 RepID=A0A840XNE8_9MICO|nr:cystathionine beta-synthase [Microcella frigidaquae]MBB5618357.1 cystathionine beta-synthase [Microcella frigidaquae]NHN44739.1 cystathionine beta-synthase [Microcella frigidaquae]